MQQFVYKNFVLENVFLILSAIKELILKFGNGQVVENLFPKKMNCDLLESQNFFKFGIKR